MIFTSVVWSGAVELVVALLQLIDFFLLQTVFVMVDNILNRLHCHGAILCLKVEFR